MTGALALARRTRRHVQSFDDAMLLARVVCVLLLMPVAVRMKWPRLIGALERASAIIGVAPGPRGDKVDFYIRACGALHWGPFQDNCVARSLARFTLLNHPARPLDVIVGVHVVNRSASGPELGRRHVWLATTDRKPFLETEPVDHYLIQFRHRDESRPSAAHDALARFVGLLGLSGAGSASLAAASIARTKLVAAFVGPAGLALTTQMSSAVNALGVLSTFGGSGTARFVAEALDRHERPEAATVIRTTFVVLVGTASLLALAGAFLVDPLALVLFGDAAASWWVAWLLAALPLAALASVATAVLRGAQLLGRLAIARTAAAAASVGGCALLIRPGDPALMVFVPLVLVAASAVATAVAAWPVCRPWLVAGGRWFAGRVARAIAAYGASQVVMSVASAAVLIAVGRHYLAAGDLDTAGRIAALVWFGEPLAVALASGHQASTYPAYAAARGPAASAVLTQGLRGLILIASPLLSVLALAAGPLIVLVFSSAFSDLTGLVAMQLLATYVRSTNLVLGLPLLARGRLTTVTSLHLLWATVLAVGAIGWAGPGIMGATAFVFAYLTANVLHFGLQLLALGLGGIGPTSSDLRWLAVGVCPLILISVL